MQHAGAKRRDRGGGAPAARSRTEGGTPRSRLEVQDQLTRNVIWGPGPLDFRPLLALRLQQTYTHRSNKYFQAHSILSTLALSEAMERLPCQVQHLCWAPFHSREVRPSFSNEPDDRHVQLRVPLHVNWLNNRHRPKKSTLSLGLCIIIMEYGGHCPVRNEQCSLTPSDISCIRERFKFWSGLKWKLVR